LDGNDERTTMTIDAGRLEDIIRDCLLTEAEVAELGHDPDLDVEHYMALPESERPFIAIEGIVNSYVFSPGALDTHRDEVREMLDQLPDNFRVTGGGGWSFLNMCQTSDGELWGEHRNVEQLAVLAIALKLGKWALPKSMWPMLPGQMPYFIYDDREAEVTT
jgi:hypothetical protein